MPDLRQEWVSRERVEVHWDSDGIADAFSECAENHSERVAVGAVDAPKHQMNDNQERKEGGEKYIATEIGNV